jgi:transposase
MGLFWDLMQQSQIKDQQRKSESLEARMANLEQELLDTRTTLHELVALLERHFGQDIDRDGQIG